MTRGSSIETEEVRGMIDISQLSHGLIRGGGTSLRDETTFGEFDESLLGNLIKIRWVLDQRSIFGICIIHVPMMSAICHCE